MKKDWNGDFFFFSKSFFFKWNEMKRGKIVKNEYRHTFQKPKRNSLYISSYQRDSTLSSLFSKIKINKKKSSFFSCQLMCRYLCIHYTLISWIISSFLSCCILSRSFHLFFFWIFVAQYNSFFSLFSLSSSAHKTISQGKKKK